LPSHVHLNIDSKKRSSSRKYSPKSVTYSDARIEFARGPPVTLNWLCTTKRANRISD